ncbi:MAG: hypothetical protein K8H86_00625, partial [Ignavibacteriaceae bacterium]|nr:hypothetical protein [Ignavibacteriaceae bacterium]
FNIRQILRRRKSFKFSLSIIKSNLIFAFFIFQFLIISGKAVAQENSDCFGCHDDETLTGTKNGRTISVYVSETKFTQYVHGEVPCIGCHVDLKDSEFPHNEDLQPAKCGGCHTAEQDEHAKSLHGKALARGDNLAPTCKSCHGGHDILPVNDPKSSVYPMKIPFLCGRCHQEGTKVQRQRTIHQDHILENFSESIHGQGLLKKGLIVAPNCASCHTPHSILPHTDPNSSISKKNIAATCTKCHVMIETVHRKIIKGELWEKKSHVLPACIDCHQPHKIRNVFYDLGMANQDCMSCHRVESIKSSKDGHSLYVDFKVYENSIHNKTACSQCHSEVNASSARPCEAITRKVDCASCHASVGDEYKKSTHGKLVAENNPNAPTCSECHGTHDILGKKDPASSSFPTNIPKLCATCHREGQKAAVRYKGKEHQIIEGYTESIHGKGLMKSGLTVTATCTGCHTAHRELPHTDENSSVNPKNVAATCGACHHGIQEQFEKSIHSSKMSKSKDLPSCNDCHSSHTIKRTDSEGFKLHIMDQCGRCHVEIAKTYFDTYHGKVSQLGYTKTAKCYDCHGAHDILAPSNPKSHLSRQNVLKTCQKCHEGATRKFAGYFTHATHHDPVKYPILFWTFWGMTGLLVGTFFIAGLHTLLWLPRSFKWKRELAKRIREKKLLESQNLSAENKEENEKHD